MRPHVGKATVEVLERLGVEVEFPEAQVCHGRPPLTAAIQKKLSKRPKI